MTDEELFAQLDADIGSNEPVESELEQEVTDEPTFEVNEGDIESFIKEDTLIEVNTDGFSRGDKLGLKVKEDEARRAISKLEDNRANIGDEDTDILIDKQHLELAQLEDELVAKNKPVPTSDTASTPKPETDVANEAGKAIGEIYDLAKGPTESTINFLQRASISIGEPFENLYNYLTDSNVDVMEKQRLLAEVEKQEINKTFDPKGKAIIDPANITAEAAGFATGAASVPIMAAYEGFKEYVKKFGETGDVVEAGKEGGQAALWTYTGGKIIDKVIGKVPTKIKTEFGKKIDDLPIDEKKAITKVLDNLDSKGIEAMDEGARSTLLKEIVDEKLTAKAVSKKIYDNLQEQSVKSWDNVQTSYNRAHSVGEKTDSVPLSSIYADMKKIASGTDADKQALLAIKSKLAGKSGNARDIEDILIDLKGKGRTGIGKETPLYSKTIEQLDEIQTKLGGDEIYAKSRKLWKEYKADFEGQVFKDVAGSTAGKTVAKASENKASEKIVETLLDPTIDVDKIGKAVFALPKADKLKAVNTLLMKDVVDVSTPQGITQLVQNYNKISVAGLDKLVGKKAASKLRLDVESLAAVEVAIKKANSQDAKIGEDLMQIAIAGIMAPLSPFLAVRTTGHGIGKIAGKKALAAQRHELIKRTKEITDAGLRNAVRKSIVTMSANQDFDVSEPFGKTVPLPANKMGEATIRQETVPVEEVNETKVSPSVSVKDQISSVESNNSYTAKNPNSSAYGKYQFLDATYKQASKALNDSVANLRTPEGQEKAMDWLIKENTSELKRRDIKPTALNVYGIHQQGGSVFSKMVKGDKLTLKQLQVIRNNIPAKHRKGNPVKNWFDYYGKKFS